MGESTKKHLQELLQSFDTAMLITHHGEEEHARPMAVAGVEGMNTLWFVTSLDTPKSEEIRRDPRVSATFQGDRRFVALSGRAELVTDRAKIEKLWKPTWRVWFPKGKNEPSLGLIRVTVTDAEFWDNAGTKGIRYAFEAAKALLTREGPPIVEGQHGRVKSPDGEPISQRY
jgi:general stress protein 26